MEASKSSLIKSRLGPRATELRPETLSGISNRAKPSWCLVVGTKYLAPELAIRSTQSLALNLDAVKLAMKSS